MSSPDSSNNNALPAVGSGGQPDVDLLELLASSAKSLQVLTALADSINAHRASTESRFTQIEGCLLDVVRVLQEQTRLQRNALAEPADPASAAEPARQVLQVERSWLWSTEALRLPRPSIIGRALYDLQHDAESDAESVYEGSKPADIYITILAKGPHHLSETASRYVTRYEAGETSDMAGKIGIHFEMRFEVLTKRTAGRILAGRSGQLRWLRGHGNNFFANWPHWDARDDDLTGDGPSPSGSPAPAGGTGAT